MSREAKAYVCKRDCFVDRYYYAGEIVTDSRLHKIVPMHFEPLEGDNYDECKEAANKIFPAEPKEEPVRTMEDLYNSSKPKVYHPDNKIDDIFNNLVDGATKGKATEAKTDNVDSGVDDLIGEEKPVKKSKVTKKQQAV